MLHAVQVYAPKLVVIYIGSNDLSAAQCDGGEATIMAAVPGIVSRCAASMASAHPHCSRCMLVASAASAYMCGVLCSECG